MQQWERDYQLLLAIGQKYLEETAVPPTDVREDFSLVRKIYDKYRKDDAFHFLDQIRPFYAMMQRKNKEIKGCHQDRKASLPGKVIDFAAHHIKKKGRAPLSPMEITENLEEKVEEKQEVTPPRKAIWTKVSLHSQIAQTELEGIKRGEEEFDAYLDRLLSHRLDETTEFGQSMDISFLENYLRGFSPEWQWLYFDSLLSIAQQYGLGNAQVVNDKGICVGGTGFNLAFFGAPGSGKTFAIKEMILGNEDNNVKAHGLPGKNRYCGGMTAARFIRMGEAYQGKRFNFIIPEFNDWFVSSKGMTDRLKLALEQGKVAYETAHETIGPYTFDSFFSVNYNTKTKEKDYQTVVNDPNFAAIEDRMLCNLHKMTKERYDAVAKSQEKLALGKINMNEAEHIRDHVTLIHAIETEYPKVRGQFTPKKILITEESYKYIARAREGLLSQVEGQDVPFSSRLEKRAVQLACALSLMSYFQQESDILTIPQNALDYAIRFYVQEAAVRSHGSIDAEYVLKELGRQ